MQTFELFPGRGGWLALVLALAAAVAQAQTPAAPQAVVPIASDAEPAFASQTIFDSPAAGASGLNWPAQPVMLADYQRPTATTSDPAPAIASDDDASPRDALVSADAEPADAAAGIGLLPQPKPAGAPLPNLTRAQVEQIVAEYLKTHPAENVAPGQAAQGTPGQGMPVGVGGPAAGFFANGLQFVSPSGDFRFHIGGMMQFDTNFLSGDPGIQASPLLGGTGPIQDSADFRRARVRLDGTLYEQFDFAMEYDFAQAVDVLSFPGNAPGQPRAATVPGLTDLYVRATQLPVVGNVTVGNFKEPIGFEHLINDRFLDFMERSYNQDVFYGGFNQGFSPGAMISNWLPNERATWAAWVGPNQSNPFGYGIGGNYAFTFRGTLLPIYDAGGRFLMHIGASFSERSPDQGQFQARAYGEVRSGPPGSLNPVYANTGSFAADSQSLFNLEYAAVWGPLTVQAEYAGEWVAGAAPNPVLPVIPIQQVALQQGSTAYFQGGYVEALWFLTGENRVYDRQAGVFGRVTPLENFYLLRGPCGRPVSGRGAWQLGARYSGMNLNSMGINGGTLNSLTIALNWYLNPNMKLQWNYDYTRRGTVGAVGPGDIYGFGMRLAMDF